MAKYTIYSTRRFDKDMDRCKRRGLPMEELKQVVKLLEETGTLPPKYKPHRLKGDWHGRWECHIRPDWLLIWHQNNNELTLLMLATGSHSDLFT